MDDLEKHLKQTLEKMRDELVDQFLIDAPKGTTRAQMDRAMPATAELRASVATVSGGPFDRDRFSKYWTDEIFARLAVELEVDRKLGVK